MIESGQRGHMVITASLASLFESPSMENGVYSATKMAVFGLARYLHDELRPKRIGVSVICPGPRDHQHATQR